MASFGLAVILAVLNVGLDSMSIFLLDEGEGRHVTRFGMDAMTALWLYAHSAFLVAVLGLGLVVGGVKEWRAEAASRAATDAPTTAGGSAP